MKSIKKFAANVLANDKRIAETILEQLGGFGKLSAMTGAKNLVKGANWLQFDIGRNKSGANRVQIVYNSGADLYDLILKKYSPKTLQEKTVAFDYKVDVEGLRRSFTSRTGLELSLGTMTGRPSNANPGRPILPPAPQRSQAPVDEPTPKTSGPPQRPRITYYEKAIRVSNSTVAEALFKWALSERCIVTVVNGYFILVPDKLTFDFVMHAAGQKMMQKALTEVASNIVIRDFLR